MTNLLVRGYNAQYRDNVDDQPRRRELLRPTATRRRNYRLRSSDNGLTHLDSHCNGSAAGLLEASHHGLETDHIFQPRQPFELEPG